jgi:hypothetical protein
MSDAAGKRSNGLQLADLPFQVLAIGWTAFFGIHYGFTFR